MQTWLEISKTNLLNNYDELAKHAGNSTLMPVIKSNAYGHGLKEVAELLKHRCPSWVGVNSLSEALVLKEVGLRSEILVLGPVFESELAIFRDLDIKFMLGHMDLLRFWMDMQNPPVCHIKVDTGMNRQGFSTADLEKVVVKIANSKPGFSRVQALATHFANVEDVTDHQYAELQLKRFNSALALFRKNGFVGMSHAASSASTLILSESRFDMVRTGISLYGLWPSKASKLSYLQAQGNEVGLRPVMQWKSRVAQIKSVPKGQFVGYGCTYKTQVDTIIGVVPVGYFEGFPRVASTKQSYVLVAGKRCLILGRICMNMMMIDLTYVENPSVSDEVVLIGTSSNETLESETLASWSETIHYELLSRINGNLERRIVE